MMAAPQRGVARKQRMWVGTSATLQRARTARATLVPLLLYEDDIDLVLQTCSCGFTCDERQLLELRSPAGSPADPLDRRP